MTDGSLTGVSDGGATKPVYKSSQRPPERCDEVASRPGCWFVYPDWAANMGAEGLSQRLTITHPNASGLAEGGFV